MATYTYLANTFYPHQGKFDLGANVITINLNSYVLGGWDFINNIPSVTQESGLHLGNPTVAGTNSFTVNVNGSLGSYNGNGINALNYLATTPDIFNVGTEGAIAGTHRGIYSQVVSTISNLGQIAGQHGITFNGFWDDESNGLAHTPGPDGLPDSNIKASSVLSVTNALGAQILGANVLNNAVGDEQIAGIANFSYAKLTVTNAGNITGGHDYYVDVDGNGQDDTGWGGAAISSHGTLTLSNAATGVIDGNVEIGWVGSSVTNAGQILGTISSGISDRIVSDTQLGGTVHLPSISDMGTPSNPADDIVDLNHDGIFNLATGDVLLSAAAVNTYSNTGLIDGTFNSGYDNNGTFGVVADDMYFKIAMELGPGKDSITNGATGQIIGDVYTGAGNDTISNSGIIRGHVGMDDGDDTFTNALGAKLYGYYNDQTVGPTVDTSSTSLWHSGLWMGDGKNIVTNAGEIDGGVGAGAGFDTLTNAKTGTIYNGVNLGTGGSKIQNDGLIDGHIGQPDDGSPDHLPLDNFNDTLINSITGQIFGGIYLGGGNNSVTNAGDINGGIAVFGGNDTIINTGTEHGGINTGDGNNTVTNSGKIYGNVGAGAGFDTITNNVGALIGDGVYVGRGGSKITNNGIIENHIGVDDGSAPLGIDTSVDTVINGATGKISNGVYLGGGNNVLTNAGTINGGIGTDAGDDSITNSGTLQGGIGAGDGRNTIVNSGVIYGDINTGNAGALLTVGIVKQETIVNSGTIHGSIFTGDGDRTITNNGAVYSVHTGSGNDIFINTKDAGDVQLGDGTNTITNSGSIHNGVVVGSGNDTIKNLANAIINAGVDMGDGTNNLDNAGTIFGSIAGSGYIAINGGSGNDTVTIEATGRTYGSIALGDGNNTFTNLGLIGTDTGGVYGWYYGGAGNDTVTNSGNVGNVLAGSGSDVITNNLTGHIRGEVVLTSYSINADGSIAGIDPTTDGLANISLAIPFVNELTNKGIIEWQVVGGDQADLVLNSGTIGGDVYLNGGNDKFDDTGAKAVGHIYLGAGDDTFIGGAINETVYDEAGHDSYVMGAGNDTVIVLNSSDDGLVNSYDGGTGNDTLDFSDLHNGNGITLQMENAVSLAVAVTNLNVGAGPNEIAINFETVIGTQYADTIIGTNLGEKIDGGQGADTLVGHGGADKIYAGITAGSLTGGDGAVDTIRFDAATDSGITAATRDVVYQFEDGIDKLEFSTLFDFNRVAINTQTPGTIGHFLGTNVAFDGTIGAVHAVQVGGQTLVEVDTNGDKIADFSVALDGIHLLQASDFIFDT